jgi:hypothetical protein
MDILARWLWMLLRNLGVGIDQHRSQSPRCVGAGCGCAARLFLQSSGLLLAGAESGDSNAARSPAESNSSAPVCSHCGCGAPFNRLGAWPVHYDGHWHWACECRGENSGIRCISILIYGLFCVLGDSLRRVCICRAPHLGCCRRLAHTSPCSSPGAALGRRWSSNHSPSAVITDMLERCSGITPKYAG